MNDCDRGKIHNRDFARQLRDFSGLRFGRITPSDIDGAVEFNDHFFVFIEAKHGSMMPRTGQRLLLERICDGLENAGKKAMVIIADSGSINSEHDVPYSSLPVYRFRFKKLWRQPKAPIQVREAIEKFICKKASPIG